MNTLSPLCYMFAGWFQGALEWVGEASGNRQRLSCAENYWAASPDHDHCLFTVTPASS